MAYFRDLIAKLGGNRKSSLVIEEVVEFATKHGI